jgi:hypothetical protein
VLILQDELVAPLLIEERLRQAGLRYLLSSSPRGPGRHALLIAAAGRLLVAAGTRLEAHASRRRPRQTWFLHADLCPDCGS